MKKESKEKRYPHVSPTTPPERNTEPVRSTDEQKLFLRKKQKKGPAKKHPGRLSNTDKYGPQYMHDRYEKSKTTESLQEREELQKFTEAELVEIQNDVMDLYPQLLVQIDKYHEQHPQERVQVKVEKAIWKRFLHRYSQTYGNTSKACDFCGISRNHFTRARDRYPALAALVNLIDERFIDEVEETTKRHSLLPNSIIERLFLLKTQRKHKYQEGDSKGGQPIQLEVTFANHNLMRKPIGVSNGGEEGNHRQLPAPASAVEVPSESV